MGEKDIAQKTLEAYNDVFADIVNVLLFQGKPLVREDDLSDLTPLSQYKKDYKPSKDTIKHVGEVLSLLSVLTKNHNLENELNAIHFEGKDGIINMEAAWQKAMDQHYRDGYSACKSHMEAAWQKEMDKKYHDGYAIGEARAAAKYQAEIDELKALLAEARR